MAGVRGLTAKLSTISENAQDLVFPVVVVFEIPVSQFWKAIKRHCIGQLVELARR
jgi:hypothetical protein